jgi:DNA-binding GntR family transcriptional regulator
VATTIEARISARILESIDSPDAVVGDQLPTIQALQEAVAASVPTVVKAYSRLAEAGWVERRQGVGYFLKSKRPIGSDMSTVANELRGVADLLKSAGDRLAAVAGIMESTNTSKEPTK